MQLITNRGLCIRCSAEDYLVWEYELCLLRPVVPAFRVGICEIKRSRAAPAGKRSAAARVMLCDMPRRRLGGSPAALPDRLWSFHNQFESI